MRSSQLLTSIKRAITVPDYQNRFSDDDIFALINEEQIGYVVPILLSEREEYTVVHDDVLLLAGSDRYQIPVRAIGRNIRELHGQSTSGSPGTFYNLPRYTLEESYRFNSAQTTGRLSGFFLEGDFIRYLPPISADQTLRVFYNQRPSDVVSTSVTGNITNITLNQVTLDMVPSNISIGSICDITQLTPGYTIRQKDCVVTAIVGSVVTFGVLTTIPAAVGDVLSLSLQTSVIQMPDEATQILIQAVALRIVEAYGDQAQVQQVKDQLQSKVQNAQKLFAPRVQGEPHVIVNRNGVLRSGITRRVSFGAL